MVIVSGTFEVDPAQRDAFLAERLDRVRASRAEAGCLEYMFSADPVQPGRVVLFERWEDQASLDAHLAGPPMDTEVAPTSASIVVYDVAGERPLR